MHVGLANGGRGGTNANMIDVRVVEGTGVQFALRTGSRAYVIGDDCTYGGAVVNPDPNPLVSSEDPYNGKCVRLREGTVLQVYQPENTSLSFHYRLVRTKWCFNSADDTRLKHCFIVTCHLM